MVTSIMLHDTDLYILLVFYHKIVLFFFTNFLLRYFLSHFFIVLLCFNSFFLLLLLLLMILIQKQKMNRLTTMLLMLLMMISFAASQTTRSRSSLKRISVNQTTSPTIYEINNQTAKFATIVNDDASNNTMFNVSLGVKLLDENSTIATTTTTDLNQGLIFFFIYNHDRIKIF